jgi:hypothetical protein
MAPGQDWCLDCGSAAPGRLGGRPGWRAALTIAALTVMLAGGAVAASYAALSSDQQPTTTAPVVAQTPAPTTAAPVTTTTTVTATTTATAAPLPPSDPTATATPPPPPKTPEATPTPSPSHGTGKKTHTKTTDGDTNTHGTGTGTTNGDGSRPAPSEVDLGPDAASVYDPYQRILDSSDPAFSFDLDKHTTFTLTTAADQPEMGIGLDFALDKAQTVKTIDITTTTPGFTVEVYGAAKHLPLNILDPAWKHLASKTRAADTADDADATDGGKTTIKLPAGTGKLRHVTLWFTAPPSAGPSIGLTEIALKH